MKFRIKTILIIIAAVVGLLILLSLWTYLSSSNDPVTTGLKKIYPAALVGHGMISINDWEENLIIAKKLEGNTEAVRQQFIRVKQMDVLAQKLRIKIPHDSFTQELNYYKPGNDQDYKKILENGFAGNESLFIQYVVKPQVLDAQLRIKYHNDLNANRDAHTRAQNILAKLNQGSKFEEVAKTDSDDKATAQIGGDLGFAQIEEFVPELRNAIQNSEIGKVKPIVIISRFGYHIIYPVETAEQNEKKLWHVRHIFVTTTGYDQWLTSQLNKVSVWRIQ